MELILWCGRGVEGIHKLMPEPGRLSRYRLHLHFWLLGESPRISAPTIMTALVSFLLIIHDILIYHSGIGWPACLRQSLSNNC